VGKEKRADVYLEERKRRGHIFPSDELDKNKQRTWLGENFSH
jgi:hypothetical protein